MRCARTTTIGASACNHLAVKCAMAFHGSRGDVQPAATVALELKRRGHEVVFATPPNLVSFVESVGLPAVAYGPDSGEQMESEFINNSMKIQNPIKFARAYQEFAARGWGR